jgi:hypothetical protein
LAPNAMQLPMSNRLSKSEKVSQTGSDARFSFAYELG